MGAMGVRNDSHDETPPLIFRKKTGQLDWKKIASVDPAKVQETMDYGTLQDNVQHITFCDIRTEMGTGTVDPHFIKVFELAQMTIEYLLFCQEQLARVVEALESRLSTSESKVANVQSQLDSCRREKEGLSESLRAAKRESSKTSAHRKRQQRVSFPLATQCPYCPKTFVHPSYLDSHLRRRHNQIHWTVQSPLGLHPQESPVSWTVRQPSPGQRGFVGTHPEVRQSIPQSKGTVWQDSVVLDPTASWTDPKTHHSFFDPKETVWDNDRVRVSDPGLRETVTPNSEDHQSVPGLWRDQNVQKSTPVVRKTPGSNIRVPQALPGPPESSENFRIDPRPTRGLDEGPGTGPETSPVRDRAVVQPKSSSEAVLDSAAVLDSVRETEESLGKRLDSLHDQLQLEKSLLISKQESLKEWQQEQMKRQQEDFSQIRSLVTSHLKSKTLREEFRTEDQETSLQVQEALRTEVADLKKQLQDQLLSFEEQVAKSMEVQEAQWSLKVERAHRDLLHKVSEGLATTASDRNDQWSAEPVKKTEVREWSSPLTSRSSHPSPSVERRGRESSSEEDTEGTIDKRRNRGRDVARSVPSSEVEAELEARLKTELETELEDRIHKLLGTERQVTGLTDSALERRRKQLGDQRQRAAQKYPGFNALRQKCAKLLRIKLKSYPKSPGSPSKISSIPTPSVTSPSCKVSSHNKVPSPGRPAIISSTPSASSRSSLEPDKILSNPARLATSPKRISSLPKSSTSLVSSPKPFVTSSTLVASTQRSSLRTASPQTSPGKGKPVKRLTFQIQNQEDESEDDEEEQDEDSSSSEQPSQRSHRQFEEEAEEEPERKDVLKVRAPPGQKIARLAATIESQLSKRTKRNMPGAVDIMNVSVTEPQNKMYGEDHNYMSSLSSIEETPLNRTWDKEIGSLKTKVRRSSWDS